MRTTFSTPRRSGVSVALLAALLLVSPAGAQDAGAGGDAPEGDPPTAAPEKPAGQEQPPAPAKEPAAPAADAPAPGAKPARPEDGGVLLVGGLTPARKDAARRCLEQIVHVVFRCKGCGMVDELKGTCPDCDQELAVRKLPVMRNVVVDEKAKSISFELVPGQKVLMSEIREALAAEKLTLMVEKIVMPRATTVYLDGVADEAAAARLQTSLEKSGVFEHVACRFLSPDKPAELRLRNKGYPPTTGRVRSLVAEADKAVEVRDVEWSAPPSKG